MAPKYHILTASHRKKNVFYSLFNYLSIWHYLSFAPLILLRPEGDHCNTNQNKQRRKKIRMCVKYLQIFYKVTSPPRFRSSTDILLKVESTKIIK